MSLLKWQISPAYRNNTSEQLGGGLIWSSESLRCRNRPPYALSFFMIFFYLIMIDDEFILAQFLSQDCDLSSLSWILMRPNSESWIMMCHLSSLHVFCLHYFKTPDLISYLLFFTKHCENVVLHILHVLCCFRAQVLSVFQIMCVHLFCSSFVSSVLRTDILVLSFFIFLSRSWILVVLLRSTVRMSPLLSFFSPTRTGTPLSIRSLICPLLIPVDCINPLTSLVSMMMCVFPLMSSSWFAIVPYRSTFEYPSIPVAVVVSTRTSSWPTYVSGQPLSSWFFST